MFKCFVFSFRYADADVVLLDDCLSAVDAHVGEHIFRHAIQGVFGGKTVILVSNQLQFLPSADYVVALEKGVIREQGKYNDLISQGMGIVFFFFFFSFFFF